jgi:hypothetical protein
MWDVLIQWCARPASTPLRKILFRFGTRARHQLFVANARKGLFGCPGESPWLPWRIALVGRENRLSRPGELNWRRTLPLIVVAKTRIQRCLSAMADEIWQYRMGGNLTIFNKDHDTAEEGRSRGLPEVKFLQPSMGVRYDCSRARVPKRNNIFLEGGWKLVMHITVLG